MSDDLLGRPLFFTRDITYHQHRKISIRDETHLMFRHFVGCAAVISAVATASMWGSPPAHAVSPGPAATAQGPLTCVITADEARFDFPLSHTAQRLASGEPIKIVALGSSSTYGAGASTAAAAYPSRLAEELTKHFPGHEFTVLNRGVNGEEITDMLARLETAVIAERPDLVLWPHFGTNSRCSSEHPSRRASYRNRNKVAAMASKRGVPLGIAFPRRPRSSTRMQTAAGSDRGVIEQGGSNHEESCFPQDRDRRVHDRDWEFQHCEQRAGIR
jgi:hypothetical protein